MPTETPKTSLGVKILIGLVSFVILASAWMTVMIIQCSNSLGNSMMEIVK